MAMRGPVSPKAVVIGLVCLALLFQGKMKLAVTIALGYLVCVQIFQMMFNDEDPTAPVAAGQDADRDLVARVQAVLPQASAEDIRAEMRRTRSIDAVIANLSGQAAVVAGAPKGRHRTVSFQSKKDSIFDKYRERYIEKFGERVKRNQDLKAAGGVLELDAALRQCRRPAGGHH